MTETQTIDPLQNYFTGRAFSPSQPCNLHRQTGEQHDCLLPAA